MKSLHAETQDELALALHTSSSWISRVARTRTIPPRWLLTALKYYRISPAWVLHGKNPQILDAAYTLDKKTHFVRSGPSHTHQLARLRLLFPGVKRSALLKQIPSSRLREFPQNFSANFLLALFLDFGINPDWIKTGQPPTVWHYEGAKLLNTNVVKKME